MGFKPELDKGLRSLKVIKPDEIWRTCSTNPRFRLLTFITSLGQWLSFLIDDTHNSTGNMIISYVHL